MINFGDPRPLPAGETEPDGLRGHSYRAEIDPPIGVLAAVRVNGLGCGLVWAPPYEVDVTRAARPGTNTVEIVVWNTAANALAHDEHLAARVALVEQHYGRRFQMQELERAMDGVRSGLITVPTLVVTDQGDQPG